MNCQPAVLLENSNGIYQIALNDVLFQRRIIQCVGTIDDDMAAALVGQIKYLSAESDEPITMYINSPGGSVDAGLMVIDAMKAARCPVHTVNLAMAASMASLIFMCGAKGHRLSLPHATVMLHDPLISGGISGSALCVYDTSQRLMQTRETLAGIIAESAGKTLEEVYGVTSKDTYFKLQEAIEWGICDGELTEL